MALSLKKKTNAPRKSRKGDLPRSSQEWTEYTNRLHDDAVAIQKKHQIIWTLSLAYYKGYQNLTFNTSNGRIEIPRSAQRPLMINRIASFIDARLAKLTKNRPVPRCIPNTNDNADVQAARYADHVLMHLWRKTELESEYESMIVQGLIYGNSFMRVLWNPFAGDYVKKEMVSDAGVLETDAEGIREEKIWMGEIDTKALSPFNILVASESIPEVKDQPWIMERSFHSVVDVEKFYPHLKGKVLERADKETQRTEYEGIIQRLQTPTSSSLGTAGAHVNDSINDEVLVKKLWIKPNPEYEDGLVVVVVGDLLAHIDKWPEAYAGVYPYFKFSERTDGAHFWDQATVERLIPIQKAYNRLKQKKLKNIFLMANGKFIVPRGSQLSESSIDDTEGEILEYNAAAGPAPQQMPLMPLPNYVTEMARELIIDFRDVSGQRESSISPPPGVTASVAMQTLSELSDEIMSPIIKRLARLMTRVANCQLRIIGEEYIEPRQVAVLGEGNEFGFTYISGADLRHHTSVHIEVESLYPDLKGQQQQRLIELWDRRILTDPQQFLKAYRFGNFDDIMEDLEKEDDIAELEIAEIKRGNEPEITPFQNHAIHFKILTKYIQSPEFLRLIPERKQLALSVLQKHMQFLTQSLPGKGAPIGQTNQAAVGTPYGPSVTTGSPGGRTA